MKHHRPLLFWTLVMFMSMTCLNPLRGKPPSLAHDELAVSTSLGVLVDSTASIGSKQKALKGLRVLLENYSFTEKGSESIRVSHSLAYKALPEIIKLMTESPQCDAYMVAILMQTSCPKPGKKSWSEWLKAHPSPLAVHWAWPDVPKVSGHGAASLKQIPISKRDSARRHRGNVRNIDRFVSYFVSNDPAQRGRFRCDVIPSLLGLPNL